jgi:hypothetical protein
LVIKQLSKIIKYLIIIHLSESESEIKVKDNYDPNYQRKKSLMTTLNFLISNNVQKPNEIFKSESISKQLNETKPKDVKVNFKIPEEDSLVNLGEDEITLNQNIIKANKSPDKLESNKSPIKSDSKTKHFKVFTKKQSELHNDDINSKLNSKTKTFVNKSERLFKNENKEIDKLLDEIVSKENFNEVYEEYVNEIKNQD